MARELDYHERINKAHAVLVRLVLPPYTIHFKSPTYMRDHTLDLLDRRACKETLKSTAQDASVRTAIGTDPKFWTELVVLFKAAVPSLERRSFTIWDPSSVDYESTSGALIASSYPGLWKDLERLNDLVSISRNVLTIGTAAQTLAAEYQVDSEIFRLINCCVRVTARGYDGEAGTGEEEKWQWIVNAYKKLLITSLQFLNNLVAQNEKRKLMLWIALFDQHINDPGALITADDIPETSRTSLADLPSNPSERPLLPVSSADILIAYGTNGEQTIAEIEPGHVAWDESADLRSYQPPQYIRNAVAAWEEEPERASELLEGDGYVFFAKRTRLRILDAYRNQLKREPRLLELHHEVAKCWATELNEQDREYWSGLYEDAVARYKADLAVFEAKCIAFRSRKREGFSNGVHSDFILDDRFAEGKTTNVGDVSADPFKAHEGLEESAPAGDEADSPLSFTDHNLQHRPVVPDDLKMLFTASAGTRILESGKTELLKRLEGYAPPDPNLPPSRNPDGVTTRPVHRDPGGNEIERTRSMSRSPMLGLHRNGPRHKAEVSSWIRMNEGRRREDMRPLPPPASPADYSNQDYRPDVADTSTVPNIEPDVEEEEPLNDDDEEEEEEADEDEDGEEEEEDEEDEEEDDEDEEDYPGSTEDGRGLLTDVPLILGPSEIEVLPMLIMSGIVPSPPDQQSSMTTSGDGERNAINNMHAVRTHLLLSQSNGRNLLRELLIFVAAWDLREEELYFKFMVKIMEAILKNGLMPYAYHAFRDRSRSKDIISPAQAVIMKLLTCIFRGRGEASKAAGKDPTLQQNGIIFGADAADINERRRVLAAQVPSRVDLHVLNFIFTEFRQHIIPQTCALIFLQGQIHAGRASPEDFPLNLWDMERMYEGVYQYLEFFAVLTEEGAWKGILAEWEMASELVTLLRELEGGGERGYGEVQLRYTKGGAIGIPKRLPSSQQLAHQAAIGGGVQIPQRSLSADAALPTGQIIGQQAQQAPAVAIERPFDVEPPPTPAVSAAALPTTLPPLPLHPPPLSGQQPIFEAETPLAYPEDPIIAPLGGQDLHPVAPLHAADQDEPSDFEWRNLKKLAVLVLSSLIWKNKKVQDQVRSYGGLEALVSCCRHDENNPYIREHAIMCLRFAVEGCEDNAKVIREMAAEQRTRQQERGRQHARLMGGTVTLDAETNDVPQEVLETSGYETFMDTKGQVGLRRKDGVQVQTQSVAGPSSGSLAAGAATGVAKHPPPPRLSATKLTAEKAAELMQNALRELPLGDKLVTDKQKAEALAKLDRAFENTETALGRRKGGG
ncbi:hypothetical protein B0A50_04262 [Salinomyces thailandicus]|uniref:Ataxin-10 homolog n=1 Tax=Salinomyces thailandicus TaxID=706561 RepID=A0A4U0TXT1_9PEZI|nr:hypothetical protein B0A50_04262 [Salinomyces thailandica]